MTTIPILEKKKQNPTLILQLFMLSTFENFFVNFHMTRSHAIMLEV